MEKIKIGIIGIGMVGTPLMRWFVEKGWKRGKDLFCYDADPKKGFYDDVSCANVVFICVPTPPNPDGSCNTSIVESVVSQFADSEKVLVIKSTIHPKTAATLAEKYNCIILFNPEFLTEAQAWEDFIRPDRQIVAPANDKARKWSSIILNLLPIGSFQSPGVSGTYDFYEANSTEAELVKYSGNVFGAIKVTFANILKDFCDILDIDYENVRKLVSHDRRIGSAWMDVSHGSYRGFGGFCFPKDLKALIVFGEMILQKLSEGEKKEVFSKALDVLKSIWDYNETLLKSQGLTVEKVSAHDIDVKKIISAKKKGRKR